jgi:hypothetical protein
MEKASSGRGTRAVTLDGRPQALLSGYFTMTVPGIARPWIAQP